MYKLHNKILLCCNPEQYIYETKLYFIILGRFCKYDYGVNRNIQYYNMKSPPDYNLSKVITPIYILHSKNDYLSARKVPIYLSELWEHMWQQYVPQRT